MQHGWPVFSSIAVERIALNELYDRWLLTCWAPPCFRFSFVDLVKLWDWNSRLFQQTTWRSSANLLCSSLLSSINEKIKNFGLFSFDGKGFGWFFYSHERSVWHNLGKHWHSNKYSSEPRQLYKFHWVPLPIYWKQFFWYYVSFQRCCKDTGKWNICYLLF